jgi:ferredoxin
MALRTSVESELEAAAGEGSMPAALDAARAAVRAGVTDVRMCSLESFEEMPVLRTQQGREEFEEAQREGVSFHPQRGPQRLVGENGRVSTIELIGVQRTYDHDGRFNPVYDPSIRETFEADSVILAIGQQADLSFLRKDDGVEVTPRGTIKVDPASLATTAPGIYAGGDIAFGPRNLIEAVGNGKQAALSIDEYLQEGAAKSTLTLSVKKIPTRQYRRAAGYDKCSRQPPPTMSLDRRTGISEVEHGYDESEARRQAERCLYCHIQTIYDSSKCVLCNRCVDICPEYCLKLVSVGDLDLPEDVVNRIVESSGISGGRPFSAMIKDDERCIRCGLCAIRCPTDAMTMEVFRYVEQEASA